MEKESNPKTKPKKRKRRANVTITNVAEKAGVSIATVSAVMNNKGKMSEATRERVKRVASDLGYRPNALAQGLRRTSSNLIALVVPDISSAFYSQGSRGILQEAYNNKRTVMIFDTSYDSNRLRQSVETFLTLRVDGVIFLGGVDDHEIIDMVHEHHLPLVLGDRRYKDYVSVEFDNRGLMTSLVNHLVDKGYSSFGYISEPLSMSNLRDRCDGLRDALEECGLVLDEKHVWIDRSLQLDKLNSAYRYVRNQVKEVGRDELPEVFLCSSDQIAIGAMKAFNSLGIRIPDELALIGFDDIREANFTSPTLSTVHQDALQMGAMLYCRLQKVIAEEPVAADVYRQGVHRIPPEVPLARQSRLVHQAK